MCKNILAIIFLIWGNLCVAQHTDTIYYDGNWDEVKASAQASYYRIISFDKSNKPSGTVRDYFISGKVQWEGSLSSADPETKEGLCTWYYENGTKSQESSYLNGKTEGKYYDWNESGKLSDVNYYVNDVSVGEILFTSGKYTLKRAGKTEDQLKVLSQQAGLILNQDAESAFIIDNIAVVLRDNERYDDALAYHLLALEIRKPLNDPEQLAYSWFETGRTYYFQGINDTALNYFSKACDAFRKAENKTYESNCSTLTGHVLYAMGDYQKAAEYYISACNLDSIEGNAESLMNDLFYLGKAVQASGDETAAMNYFYRVLDLAKAENDAETQALCHLFIAYAQENLNRNQDAELSFKKSLDLYETLGQTAKTFDAASGLSSFFYNTEQFDSCIHYTMYIINTEAVAQTGYDLAGSFNMAGLAYNGWGKPELSLDWFNRFLKLSQQQNNLADIATAYGNLGTTYTDLRNYEEALNFLLKGTEIEIRSGGGDNLGTHYSNIGRVYLQQGKFDKAIEFFEKARAMDSTAGSTKSLAVDYSNLADVYKAWGKYDVSIDYYHQAIEIYEKVNSKNGLSSCYNQLGTVYNLKLQFLQALGCFQKALEIVTELGNQQRIATTLNNIGLCYSYLHSDEEALKYYRQAYLKELQLGSDCSHVLTNIAAVFSNAGQSDSALVYQMKALELQKLSSDDIGMVTSYNNIAVIYEETNQLVKAAEYYTYSVELKEKFRKTAPPDIRRDYLASQILTYQFLIDCYLRQHEYNKAIQTFELSRSKVLSENLTDNGRMPEIPSLSEIQKNISDSSAYLVLFNVDDGDGWYNVVELLITSDDLDYSTLSKFTFCEAVLGTVIPDTNKKIQSDAGDNQRGVGLNKAVNHIFSTYKNTAAESRNGLFYSESFDQFVNYYRELVMYNTGNNAIDAEKLSRLFYNYLLDPFKEKLKGKTELVISPDGVLGLLPFETFADSNGKFLVEQFDVRYFQSFSVQQLLASRTYSKKRNPLLALGGAIYNETTYADDMAKSDLLLTSQSSSQLTKGGNEMVSNDTRIKDIRKRANACIIKNAPLNNLYAELGIGQWGNLPGSLAEVRSMCRIVPGSDTLTGAQINEKDLKNLSVSGKLATYAVIHFSTHGISVPDIPELSALILSQFSDSTRKNGEDGYLTMGEISELKLNADFVNLSACETGLGKIYSGEGIVGLTQAFIIAGANGISVSLWQVADQSTARFMVEVYQRVQTTGCSYPDAICQVKRDYISGKFGEKWKLPYYWAPFVYYGQ